MATPDAAPPTLRRESSSVVVSGPGITPQNPSGSTSSSLPSDGGIFPTPRNFEDGSVKAFIFNGGKGEEKEKDLWILAQSEDLLLRSVGTRTFELWKFPGDQQESADGKAKFVPRRIWRKSETELFGYEVERPANSRSRHEEDSEENPDCSRQEHLLPYNVALNGDKLVIVLPIGLKKWGLKLIIQDAISGDNKKSTTLEFGYKSKRWVVGQGFKFAVGGGFVAVLVVREYDFDSEAVDQRLAVYKIEDGDGPELIEVFRKSFQQVQCNTRGDTNINYVSFMPDYSYLCAKMIVGKKHVLGSVDLKSGSYNYTEIPLKPIAGIVSPPHILEAFHSPQFRGFDIDHTMGNLGLYLTVKFRTSWEKPTRVADLFCPLISSSPGTPLTISPETVRVIRYSPLCIDTIYPSIHGVHTFFQDYGRGKFSYHLFPVNTQTHPKSEDFPFEGVPTSKRRWQIGTARLEVRGVVLKNACWIRKGMLYWGLTKDLSLEMPEELGKEVKVEELAFLQPSKDTSDPQ